VQRTPKLAAALKAARKIRDEALTARGILSTWVRGQRSECVFRRLPPRGITLGIGDVVSVTIFEAEAGGLFVPSEAGARPGNFVMLPEQIVDSNGNIKED
jgi:hypothetical protein